MYYLYCYEWKVIPHLGKFFHKPYINVDNIDQPAPDSATENTYVDVGYKDEV